MQKLILQITLNVDFRKRFFFLFNQKNAKIFLNSNDLKPNIIANVRQKFSIKS